MGLNDWIALATAVATLVGVVVAVLTLRDVKRQLTLQNFSDYTKRYEEIILRFPEDINEPGFQLHDGRDDFRSTMRAMRTYFDLCFEEWFLHQQGFIDRRIWAVWESGIRSALSKTAFQQAWKRIREDSQFGESFETFIGR